MQYLPLILIFALAIPVSAIVVKLITKPFSNIRRKGNLQVLNQPDIQRAIKAGRVIEAIQLLHKNHGMGLREAKHLIDECTPQLSSPPTPSKKNDADVVPTTASEVTTAKATTEVPIVNGEVWINNSNAHVTLRPWFGTRNISLRNEGTSGGPHTEIYLSSEELASKLAEANSGELTISLNGPNTVGSISDLSGYAAADAGSHTRWITARH